MDSLSNMNKNFDIYWRAPNANMAMITPCKCKPIVRLNDGAKKLSKGNYNADFNGKGYLER